MDKNTKKTLAFIPVRQGARKISNYAGNYCSLAGGRILSFSAHGGSWKMVVSTCFIAKEDFSEEYQAVIGEVYFHPCHGEICVEVVGFRDVPDLLGKEIVRVYG